ncbi:hypothetical protein MHBO_004465 [Bonamia ostreae]|uniref:Uncharacterized protein n=1 Tax=Bonamia ostreae TaxID=126728 RepID=A0ABV2ATW2_9EUKA
MLSGIRLLKKYIKLNKSNPEMNKVAITKLKKLAKEIKNPFFGKNIKEITKLMESNLIQNDKNLIKKDFENDDSFGDDLKELEIHRL